MTDAAKRSGIFVAAVLLAACTPSTLLDFELDTPATVLEPVGAPPLTDARGEYRAIFCAMLQDEGDCGVLLHRLGDEEAGRPLSAAPAGPGESFRIFIVPGLFGECIKDTVLPFEDAFDRLAELGHEVETINVSGRSSSSFNAAIINETLSAIDSAGDRKIILVGHSKGVADILHSLVEYPALAPQVAAVIGVAGVVNGSPTADGAADFFKGLARKIPFGACPPGDGMAIDNLQRTYLLPWIRSNPLPDGILYVSIAAFASRDNTSTILQAGYNNLATIDPRNDSLVIYYDQVIPGSHLLGFANADHWAVALPFETKTPFLVSTLIDKNHFPRTAMLEAALVYIGNHLQQ